MPIRSFALAGLVAVVGATTGCSVYMAATQPPRKDLSVIHVGASRGKMIAEFGAPVSAGHDASGARVEHYRFTQGFSAPLKAGRAVFHGAADVLTIGLWEIVGTPTEAVWNGTDYLLKVTYDEQDRLLDSELLEVR